VTVNESALHPILEVMLVASAWLSATFAPALLTKSPQGVMPYAYIGVFGWISLSCYMGIRAYRRGFRTAFILRTVITLALLSMSTALGLVGFWSRVFE